MMVAVGLDSYRGQGVAVVGGQMSISRRGEVL